MTRQDGVHDRPRLRLEGGQPRLYRKRRVKRRELRGRGRDRGEPNIHLDGDQHLPHIYRRRRIRWTSVVKWSALAIVLMLAVGFMWGFVWLKGRESRMRIAGVDEVLDPKRKGQPETTLILGIDRGSVPGERQSRSDIMMLVSCNPSGGNSAVISVPRDSRVRIAGQEGYDKINAAHAYGGPRLAIRTVKDLTGLAINHYVEIDFEGFKQIVNAIGGVRMRIEVAIHDKYAGDVPAGDVVLNGDQALSLVRARHDVNAVPAGDLDRIKNQRRFLQAMLSTVSRARNPFKVMNLIEAASKSVKTDLTFTEMLSLGRRLQSPGRELTMTTAPGATKIVGGAWYYIIDMPGFRAMLESFRTRQVVDAASERKSETRGADRAGLKVQVLNGTGVPGLAAAVAGELGRAGYKGVTTGNAESRYSRTTVYYAGDDSYKAGTVAADLSGASEPMIDSNDELTSARGVDVLVVLGSDYRKP